MSMKQAQCREREGECLLSVEIRNILSLSLAPKRRLVSIGIILISLSRIDSNLLSNQLSNLVDHNYLHLNLDVVKSTRDR